MAARREEADGIIGLELVAEEGSALPAYQAGAHIDVEVKSGLIRQYSLTGDPTDRTRYRLGILKDPQSRGGSAAVHDAFTVGHRLRIGPPRNHSPLAPAEHSQLFAGGIGITPLLSMAYALQAQGASWALHYCGRSAARMAFLPELAAFGGKVHLHFDDGDMTQKLDIAAVLQNPSADRHLYVCGPGGFMDWVTGTAKAASWQDDCVHLEHFAAEVDTDGAAFTVIAQRSGKTIEVPPGRTIAEELGAHGIDVPVSCQSGVCGTCLTRVVEGIPDHRDLVLTDLEKAANDQMTLCCSRSKSKRLVLDI